MRGGGGIFMEGVHCEEEEGFGGGRGGRGRWNFWEGGWSLRIRREFCDSSWGY